MAKMYIKQGAEIKMPITRVIFKDKPDLIVDAVEYRYYGGFMKFCAEYSIQPKDIDKIIHEEINYKDYPTQEWEG